MKPRFINQKYSVSFHEYSEKHYIKEFEKKYKTHWDSTRKAIVSSLERIANLDGTNSLDFICISNQKTILAKFDFKVAKTNVSPKSSGNRCILEVCNEDLGVKVLLVYCKDHIDRKINQETLWWKEHVATSCKLVCI